MGRMAGLELWNATWKVWRFRAPPDQFLNMTCLPAKPPVPVLCANYSGPFHGSDQGNEAHVLWALGVPWEKHKNWGGSGGSLNTVCHFSKFCFCFLFCFASWLLTLRKLQISRREEQRSDHRCWSSREEVKPQRGQLQEAGRCKPELSAWALSPSCRQIPAQPEERSKRPPWLSTAGKTEVRVWLQSS